METKAGALRFTTDGRSAGGAREALYHTPFLKKTIENNLEQRGHCFGTHANARVVNAKAEDCLLVNDYG